MLLHQLRIILDSLDHMLHPLLQLVVPAEVSCGTEMIVAMGKIATCSLVFTVSMGWMKACAMVRAAVPAMMCRTCSPSQYFERQKHVILEVTTDLGYLTAALQLEAFMLFRQTL